MLRDHIVDTRGTIRHKRVTMAIVACDGSKKMCSVGRRSMPNSIWSAPLVALGLFYIE
ncbi:MAG: hypothetical protein R2788_05530 [Saprospiraceae bacterium]